MTKNLTVEEIQREQLAMVQRSEAQANARPPSTRSACFPPTYAALYVDTPPAAAPVVHDADLDFYLLFRMDDILAVNREPGNEGQLEVTSWQHRRRSRSGSTDHEHRSTASARPVLPRARSRAVCRGLRPLANELIDGFIDRRSRPTLIASWCRAAALDDLPEDPGAATRRSRTTSSRFKNLVLGNETRDGLRRGAGRRRREAVAGSSDTSTRYLDDRGAASTRATTCSGCCSPPRWTGST